MGNNIREDIGLRISKLRELRNLSQAQLASELGKMGLKVRRETVTQWENGTRDLKTEYTIKLAEFFNVSCDYILRGIEAENISVSEKTGLSDEAIKQINVLSKCKRPCEKFTLSEVQEKVFSAGYTKIMLSFLDFMENVHREGQIKKQIIEQLESYHEPVPQNIEQKIAEWALTPGYSLYSISCKWGNAKELVNFSLFKLQECIRCIAEKLGEEIENG